MIEKSNHRRPYNELERFRPAPWIGRDPENVIQRVTVNGINVGRNPETFRVLDALPTDELCPCKWTAAGEVLKPVAA